MLLIANILDKIYNYMLFKSISNATRSVLYSTIQHLFTILMLKFIVFNNCNKIYRFSFQSIAAHISFKLFMYDMQLN